jgi:hypothetical protein
MDDNSILHGSYITFPDEPRICRRCGGSVDIMGTLCRTCLTADSDREVMRLSGEILQINPTRILGVARDENMQRHLVRTGYPNTAWCGAKLKEAQKNRLRGTLDALPDGVCLTCRGLAHRARKGEFK